MHERTRRLGVLDAAIGERLLGEALRQRFTPHARGRYEHICPLRHGETAYIRELGSTEEVVYQHNLDRFPAFKLFLRSFFCTDRVGKSYWHRMKAGTRIYRHIDVGDYYERTHRFQFFPRTDSGHVGLIEGAEQRFASGTLVAFNPAVPHAYENRSDEDCVFLVFDLYPGCYRLSQGTGEAEAREPRQLGSASGECGSTAPGAARAISAPR